MYKMPVKYTDYNGVEKTRDFYFHFSKAEVAEMELSVHGGYAEMIQAIVDAQDAPTLIKIFKELVLKAYGEKSTDGERFVKSPELSAAFEQHPAFSDIYMKLAFDAEAASVFVKETFPKPDKQ